MLNLRSVRIEILLAGGVSKMAPVESNDRQLSSFNHSTITILHHHSSCSFMVRYSLRLTFCAVTNTFFQSSQQVWLQRFMSRSQFSKWIQQFKSDCQFISEQDLESRQTSKMELFAKAVNDWKLFTRKTEVLIWTCFHNVA